jgi:hypothetical protein
MVGREEIVADYKETMRRLIVRQWMAEQERSIAWVARKVGYTREYLTNVMNAHLPFTDKLARAFTERLGVRFEYREDLEQAPGDEAEDTETPAHSAAGGLREAEG